MTIPGLIATGKPRPTSTTRCSRIGEEQGSGAETADRARPQSSEKAGAPEFCARKPDLGGSRPGQAHYPVAEVEPPSRAAEIHITDLDHRSAIGIHVGLRFVMIHAPPKAISPAYTICGSIAMSAEMSPTIAPSTDWTAFNRSFATL